MEYVLDLLARKLTRELLNAAEAGNLAARRRVLRIVRVLVLRAVADLAKKRKVDPQHLAKVDYAILEIPSRVEHGRIWFERSAVCHRALRHCQPGAERLIQSGGQQRMPLATVRRLAERTDPVAAVSPPGGVGGKDTDSTRSVDDW